jgi:hypothetical protein
VIINHIKGHQDRKNQNLNEEALLDIAADRLATASLTRRKVEEVKLPGDTIQLTINDKHVTSHFTKNLRNSFHAGHMSEIFQQKYKERGERTR